MWHAGWLLARLHLTGAHGLQGRITVRITPAWLGRDAAWDAAAARRRRSSATKQAWRAHRRPARRHLCSCKCGARGEGVQGRPLALRSSKGTLADQSGPRPRERSATRELSCGAIQSARSQIAASHTRPACCPTSCRAGADESEPHVHTPCSPQAFVGSWLCRCTRGSWLGYFRATLASTTLLPPPGITAPTAAAAAAAIIRLPAPLAGSTAS